MRLTVAGRMQGCKLTHREREREPVFYIVVVVTFIEFNTRAARPGA